MTTGAPILETDRLILRPLRASDAAAMSILANDFGVARMTTAIPHPFALKHAEDFIARMERNDPAREAVFAIEHRAEGFIGVLGFHRREGAGHELGYWIGRSHWGCGHMTEAVRAAVDWARDDWGRRLLLSGHFCDNLASGAVLVKAGFLYTGEVRPRFSVARNEEASTRMMIWLA